MASYASAETAALATGIVQGSKVFNYVVSRPQLETMFKEGRHQDFGLRLGLDCPGQMQVTAKQILLLSDIELPDEKSNPVRGMWQVRYDLTRCGETKLYNIIWQADPAGEQPRVLAYFPGNSLASLQLIRDAMQLTTGLAKARLGAASCESPNQVLVSDMRVDELPHQVIEGDRTFEKVWTEDWTFAVCGKSVTAHMRFVLKPKDGGTDWTTSFPAAADAPR